MIHRRPRKALLAASVVALCLLPVAGAQEPDADPAKTKRLYLVGNSLTDSINKQGLQFLAESRGYRHIWEGHMMPGAPIRVLWNLPDNGFRGRSGGTSKALAEHAWDVVTMQPVSDYEKELEAAGKIVDLARTTNPDVQVYIFATWPFTTGGSFDTQWVRGDSVRASRRMLESFLHDLRKAHPGGRPPLMIPTGHTMHLLEMKIRAGLVPGMSSIYDGYLDIGHQNNLGSYICSCSWFATIYGESPVGLPTEPFDPIDPALARIIQETAWEAVNAHPDSGVKAPGEFRIITPWFPDAIEGEPFERVVEAAFGETPLTWSLGGGKLPEGIAVDPAGRLAGTAAKTGDYAFTLKAVDARGRTATRELKLTCAPESAPTIPEQALPVLRRGEFVRLPLKADGGNGDIFWTVDRVQRKAVDAEGNETWKGQRGLEGLTMSHSGVLWGSCGVEGEYRVRVAAQDSDPLAPDRDTREFDLTVGPAGPEVFLVPLWEDRDAMTIDGKLHEPFWNIETPVANAVIGKPSCKASFAAVWNMFSLYVAVRVQDEAIVGDSDEPWNDDSVEVFLDVRNSRLKEYDNEVVRVVLGPSGKMHVVGLHRNPEAKVTRTEDGYTVEMRIIRTRLRQENFVFGFDVAVNDDDDGGERDGQVVWQGTARNDTDPSGFGTIILSGPGDGERGAAQPPSSASSTRNVSRSRCGTILNAPVFSQVWREVSRQFSGS